MDPLATDGARVAAGIAFGRPVNTVCARSRVIVSPTPTSSIPGRRRALRARLLPDAGSSPEGRR
jgi:hypothetical protein